MRLDWGTLLLFVACVLVMCRRPIGRSDDPPRPLGDVVHTLADGGPEEADQ